MPKMEEARRVLAALNVPTPQRSDLCCYTLLALAALKEKSRWGKATNDWLRVHDIMRFVGEHYGVAYAENSRETFRKTALHHFRNAAMVEDNGTATNSPNYRYRLTDEFLSLLRAYGGKSWASALADFAQRHQSLVDLYAAKRASGRLPVSIGGSSRSFSAGKHNQLQKAILEQFAPRFAPNAACLYVGDTADKNLHKDTAALAELGVGMTEHDKLPDVILYDRKKRWLYFIEAVTSVGEMSPRRVLELQQLADHTTVGKIFVTAFLDFKTFKKFSAKLAWETEVWIAEQPDHMIHFDGMKWLEPY